MRTLLPLLLIGLLPVSALATPGTNLVAAARTQVGVTLSYDPAYVRLAYPGGDVPLSRGVCTDVVVRAYRKLGADLQVLVNEDMKKAWSAYPRKWQLKGTDRNIDHRRVGNLATFFARHGSTLPPSISARDFQPGDIVTWSVPLPHIGIVGDRKSATGVPLMIHNIGSGAKEEDMLFSFPITGHYRWTGRPK